MTTLRPILPSARGAWRRWLVLPGLGQCGAHWTVAARWFIASGVEALTIDMGAAAARSPFPRGTAARLSALGTMVARLVEQEGVTAIVGHSAGAPVALAAALEVVAGRDAAPTPDLVIVEPVPAHFGLAEPDPAAVPSRLIDGYRTLSSLQRLHLLADASTLRSILAARPRWPEESPLSGGSAPSLATLNERASMTRTGLTRWSRPMLVVHGELSSMLSARQARQLAALAARGHCMTVARAGHSPHVDRPQDAVRSMTSFPSTRSA